MAGCEAGAVAVAAAGAGAVVGVSASKVPTSAEGRDQDEVGLPLRGHASVVRRVHESADARLRGICARRTVYGARRSAHPVQ